VDAQDKHQLDLSVYMGKMKGHAPPWRLIAALALAIVAGGIASEYGQGFGNWLQQGHLLPKIVTAVATAAFALFASLGLVGMASKTRDVLRPMAGEAHAAIVRYAIALVGGVIALVVTLSLVKVPIGKLVVGGALTTIIIGIAAQSWLANVFAGLVLLVSRPFAVGDLIRIRSGSLNGPIDGVVTEIGIIYLRVTTSEGPLHLPNSQVLNAAVGAAPPAGAGQVPPAGAGQVPPAGAGQVPPAGAGQVPPTDTDKAQGLTTASQPPDPAR
jgi:hypothetical protein